MTRQRLPEVVVIGAMKCATSALHGYLDAHPEVCMSQPKELNFFNGPQQPPHGDAETWWVEGQWHRGLNWYASQFDPDAPVRGESSPAYASPRFPEVASRMQSVVPVLRLVYLVRDPVDRAVSQYAHHCEDGTETRPVEEAVLDPGSQYIARSRYVERLAPFLEHFDPQQGLIVVQERLLHDPAREVARIDDHVGVTPRARLRAAPGTVRCARTPVDKGLRRALLDRVADDVDRLPELLDDPVEEWDQS